MAEKAPENVARRIMNGMGIGRGTSKSIRSFCQEAVATRNGVTTREILHPWTEPQYDFAST